MVSNCKDIISTDDLSTIPFENFDSIFVDEIQFYKNISAVLKWLAAGKEVFCAGLNGDTTGAPWSNVSFLIPYATKVKLLHAVCRSCFKKTAVRSCSVEDMKEGQVRIGAEGDYYTLCISCVLNSSS
jgi:thymidine kinase